MINAYIICYFVIYYLFENVVEIIFENIFILEIHYNDFFYFIFNIFTPTHENNLKIQKNLLAIQVF